MTAETHRAQWEQSDPQLKMLSWIEGLPAQMQAAVADWPSQTVASTVEHGIVVAAMGGSAMAAQVALTQLAGKMPAFVIRSDTLPSWVKPGWLCIACSYSGNTRETLACLEQALQRGCTVCSVSSGGVLAERASAEGILHRKLTKGQPPRTAVGQAVAGLLWILWTMGLVDDPRDDLRSTAALLSLLWKQGLGGMTPWESEPGRIAQTVRDTYTMVAGAGLTMPAAMRWSQQLNENAKLPCFALEVPEMLHNHVEGMEAAARAGAVLIVLADRSHSLGESAALDYLASVYGGFGGRAFAVTSRGSRNLERIFSLMYIGDQVSYLASLLRGMDPTPVERIGHLKKVLATGAP